jgi:hypothetical protein
MKDTPISREIKFLGLEIDGGTGNQLRLVAIFKVEHIMLMTNSLFSNNIPFSLQSHHHSHFLKLIPQHTKLINSHPEV